MKHRLILLAEAGAVGLAASGGAAASATVEAAPLVSPIAGTKFGEYKFHFKKDKKLGTPKRESVALQLPFPTEDTVVSMLGDEKQKALLLALLADAVIAQARDQVSDEAKPVNTQEELDLSKLTMEAIANIPPSDRRGGGISKETWEEFAADYITVMQATAGKTAEQAGNAAKLMVARLQPVKTNKKVLQFVNDQLGIWYTNTQAAEDFAEVYEFLSGKIKTFMEADEAALLANL